MLKRAPLEADIGATEYFQRIRHLGEAILLDSGRPACERGRYDIISAAPLATLSCSDGVLNARNLPFELGEHTAFSALEKLQAWGIEQGYQSSENTGELPFCGGLMGYFSYDLGRTLEQMPSIAKHDLTLPQMHLGLYGWAVIIDHQTASAELIASALVSAQQFDELLQTITTPSAISNKKFLLKEELASEISEDTYMDALARIQEYILAGDCYQVNFAQRFSADCEGDPWHAYQSLRLAAPTHFSAFIDTAEGAILSLSPERFLAVDRDGAVMTQPIKGTQPRGETPDQDEANRAFLANSPKDRAENLMIVDLLRNDISKSCEPHSVKVPSIFAIESYRNVHHLVSTITGQLSPDHSALGLLQHAFPGGSITGAPKIRSMQIIDELETHRRSIYCGSIGYFSFCGNMDTSITIRTLLVEKDRIYCWAGGGIVADSKPAAEYQETFDKVNNLLRTLHSEHLAV
ncbi:MAG: aminodeoxychorismate synthase component I [Pseudomonadales bacterium]